MSREKTIHGAWQEAGKLKKMQWKSTSETGKAEKLTTPEYFR
jgi:hypothetical protein